MGELRRAEQPNKKVVIAGGGNIGYGLAKAIEEDYDIKIVERDISRANWLEDGLSRSIVINGSATDKDMLIEENIDQCDAFCAVTNDDDINIMSSLMAKRLGVKQVITLIGKRAYVDLMHDSPSIDVVISPQQVATSMLLSHVRRADIARVIACVEAPPRPLKLSLMAPKRAQSSRPTNLRHLSAFRYYHRSNSAGQRRSDCP